MTPILYYLPPSPPCRAVLLLARYIDLELDLRVINILEGEHLKNDFLQINPQHTIPTLNDQGLIIWESRAILAYLVGAYGKDDKLYPQNVRERALIDHRLQFDLGTLYQRTADYFYGTLRMGASLDEGKKAKLNEALYWFDTMLKGKTWAAIDNFTIADISLCVTVSQIESFGFELGPYARIRAWLQRCKDELEPHGYEDINQAGANVLTDLFHSKLQKT